MSADERQSAESDAGTTWPACATYPNLGCVCRGALGQSKSTCTRRRTGDLTQIPNLPPAEKGASEPLPMFHADGTNWRTSARGRLICRECEKSHKRERKDRRHRERGDRCGCGTDATSLNPAEMVVHNWGGGPCRVVSAIPPESSSFLTTLLAEQGATWDERHGVTPPAATGEDA